MSDGKLEQEVLALRSEIERIAGSGNVRLEDFAKVEAIYDRLVPLERELARGRSLPFAVPMEWPSKWYKESYGPEVCRANGTAIIIHGIAALPQPLKNLGYGVIEVQSCSAINVLGAPEHAYTRHPLFGAGLRYEGVYIVENSDLMKLMGSLHDARSDFFQARYRPTHFLFAFENAFIDCLAQSVRQAGIWPTLTEARTNAHELLFPSGP